MEQTEYALLGFLAFRLCPTPSKSDRKRVTLGSGRRVYRRHHMTDAEVKEAFERTGWAIREVTSGEFVGESGKYAIRTDEVVLGDETVFELRDEELEMKAYARRVPTPERAAELLDSYGVPAGISEVTPGKVPMVPPEAEEDN
jgi:hypothetical protein